MAHWLYPINEKSHYYLVSRHGTHTKLTVPNLLADIERRPRTDWGLRVGFRVIRRDDIVWVYSAGTTRRICAVARATGPAFLRPVSNEWAVPLEWIKSATAKLQRHPISYEQLGQRVQAAAMPANSAASIVLDAWWRDQHLPAISTSPFNPAEVDDHRRRAKAEVVRRQGQQAFRRKVLEAYGDRCAITGCRDTAVLEAAHISRYMGSHSNHPTNSLLLRADLHTLFDLNLICIDELHRIRISPDITDPSYRALEGHRLRKPVDPKDAPSVTALAAHRALSLWLTDAIVNARSAQKEH